MSKKIYASEQFVKDSDQILKEEILSQINNQDQSVSWNDLTNKPFGKTVYSTLDCTYDYNHVNNTVDADGQTVWYLGTGIAADPESTYFITDSNGETHTVSFEEIEIAYPYFLKTTLTVAGDEIKVYSCLKAGTADGITFPEMGEYATAPLYAYGMYITKIEHAEYNAIDEKFLPESVSLVGHTHSYNDLTDRPFYEEESLTNTLTWDGTGDCIKYIADPEDMGGYYYKAADIIDGISSSDIIGGTLVENGTLVDGSSAIENIAITYRDIFDNGSTLSVLNRVGPLICLESVSASQMGTDRDFERGIYFIKTVTEDGTFFTESLTVTNNVFVTKTTKQLDEKYIPENIARVSDVNEKIDERLTPTTLYLASPNGTKFAITIGDDGILTATGIVE